MISIYQTWIYGSRLRHAGPAVVPHFETCGKRVKKPRFHPPLTGIFFCFINAGFVGLFLVVVFSLFGADCLSRSVHYAPDENDRPSEQTNIF